MEIRFNAAIGAVFAGLRRHAILSISLASLFVGAVISVYFGQDASWDLKNYHLYLGYSALSERFSPSFLNMQMYFNPTLDVPYSWLALGPLYDHPRLLAAIMGIWYGALIALVCLLACGYYASWTGTRRKIALVSAAAVATTGTAIIAQVGSTSNEIQDSILVLSGLLILQRLIKTHQHANPLSVLGAPLPVASLLTAGAFLGLATGLKLTASIYSPAACLALICVVRFRQWVTWCLVIIGGWVPGFTLSAGWWSWKLWAKFESPTFPLLNGVFRSPWYPPVNFFDRRFLPQTDWQWLFYPLTWMETQNRVLELPFRDWRGGTVLLLALMTTLVSIGRRAQLLSFVPQTGALVSKDQRFFLGFLLFSYVLWLWTSSILRYAIPVEVVAGISIPLLVDYVASLFPPRARHQAWAIACVPLIMLVILTTRYPQSQHAAYRSPVIQADIGQKIPPDALVILAGGANSYAAPFLSAQLQHHLVSVDHTLMEARGFRLYDAVMKRLREHRGPYSLLWDPTEVWVPTMLRQVDLTMPLDMCRYLDVKIGAAAQQLKICAAQLQATAALSSNFWRRAVAHYKKIEVHEKWPPRWTYPAFVRAVGRAAHGIDIVDGYQKLWPLPHFGKQLDANTLYVFNSDDYKGEAMKVINPSSDMLSEVDGFVVLAPRWKQINREQSEAGTPAIQAN